MKTRCEGCGVKIQTLDPTKIGYIRSEVYLKNPDDFLCERCYNLIHYHKNVEVLYNENDFLNNVKKIADSKGLVVNIVDIFDLEGTCIENINQLFPNSKIILVANKFDLFLNTVNVSRVKEYLNRYLKSKSIDVDKSLIISSFKQNDIIRLLKTIEEFAAGRDAYLFGVTNVGKSSIINQISRLIHQNNPKVTVSNTVGTTLDFIKIGLFKHSFIIDTPGIINPQQITFYLDRDNLKRITPKRFIKPIVYQLNPEQALFIGGFCIIKFISGIRSSFVVNVPESLPIHRTKLEQTEQFFKMHQDDILKIPNPNEREKMGKLKTYRFSFDENQKTDLSISGLGFVTLVGAGELEVVCYEKIKVSLREAII